MSEYYEQTYRSSHEHERPSLPPPPTQEREREPHALNLKVLRASRPKLSQNPDLVDTFDNASSGLPSTSNFTLTPLLALPTAFGNINLGETFTGIVVAANDSKHDVLDASMRIEMQTQSTRVILWEASPNDPSKPRILKAGECIEAPLISYEIKEPGLHALTCSVSYWLPITPNPYEAESSDNQRPERSGRSFRKLYKFQSSNPLSVRTKVHTTKNVAAQIDSKHSDTVFLEVQVQNISPDPLLFEKITFEPVDGIACQDLTPAVDGPVQTSDVLQCLYTLLVKPERKEELYDKAKASNGAMGLGKLDIRWRGRMGDPGRLSTSQLVRRLPQPEQPATLPPSRPHSPAPHQRPSFNASVMVDSSSNLSAADGYHTPIRNARTPSPSHSPRLASGNWTPPTRASGQFEEQQRRHPPPRPVNLFADLSVLPMNGAAIPLAETFAVQFRLKLTSVAAATVPSIKRRRLRLAAQHVDHHDPASKLVSPTSGHQEGGAPAPSAVPLLHSYGTPTNSARQSLETNRPLPPTPRTATPVPAQSVRPDMRLPAPLPMNGRADREWPRLHASSFIDPSATPSPDVSFHGDTLLELPLVEIQHGKATKGEKPHATEGAASDGADLPRDTSNPDIRISTDSTESANTDDLPLEDVMRKQAQDRKQSTTVDFMLQYLPLATGLHQVGGVRILLLEDSWVNEGEERVPEESAVRPCILAEHNVVVEVLVESRAS